MPHVLACYPTPVCTCLYTYTAPFRIPCALPGLSILFRTLNLFTCPIPSYMLLDFYFKALYAVASSTGEKERPSTSEV